MFNQKVARYINVGLEERGWTYKFAEKRCGVPASTLHAYAQGRVKSPNDEYLVAIAVAFGDPPEIIQQMRREALATTTETNMIIARANDKALMEDFIELINANIARLLEQSRIDSDNRYVNRLNTVRDQYNKLFEEQKASYHAQLEDNKQQSAETYAKATEYLKKDIGYYRKAVVCIIVAALLLIIPLGGYSIYCYKVFDRADPTRGIYQATPSPVPSPVPLAGDPVQ